MDKAENEKKSAVDNQKYKIIRDRWDKEDTLLISRTGVFLTTNSILYAAAGFQARDPAFQIGVAVIGLVLSIVWLTTSWHTANVIKKLYQLCKDAMPYNMEDIYRIKPVLFQPNTVFGKIVPSLIIAGWVAYIAWIVVLLR